MADALPDLFVCTDAAVQEIILARNDLIEQIATLGVDIKDLSSAQSLKHAAILALSAEQVSKKATQIKALADSLHRGVAKRLQLEPRVP